MNLVLTPRARPHLPCQNIARGRRTTSSSINILDYFMWPKTLSLSSEYFPDTQFEGIANLLSRSTIGTAVPEKRGRLYLNCGEIGD
ncbi:uncharacterized protein A1O5_01604 [Cladophialophora psammophila CBS 110553]|uniref:Uncharacterized protein n=1 Tax=Cladophialophora psammophila CBS 110553 TaxID=1182543 RepID=W9X404_9EURO|nr:uncharacterized protein A1O5_01604 [Cladophialophora psammophila CBS 110553]EXJ74908.1 hypothetical protein A1O5_01604 [Cladophialophora psammophila CBS 110553]